MISLCRFILGLPGDALLQGLRGWSGTIPDETYYALCLARKWFCHKVLIVGVLKSGQKCSVRITQQSWLSRLLVAAGCGCDTDFANHRERKRKKAQQ